MEIDPASVKEDSSRVNTLETKRRRSNVLSVFGILFVLLVASWILIREDAGFPKLAPGLYFGYLELLDSGATDGVRPENFLLLSTESEDFFIAVPDSAWGSGVVAYHAFDNEDAEVDRVKPLAIQNSFGRVQLSGVLAGAGLYQGQVEYLDKNIKSSWELRSVAVQAQRLGGLSAEALQERASIFQRYRKLEAQRKQMKAKRDKQLKEIETLNNFITNPESLKERAADRFTKVQRQYADLKEAVDALMNQASKLESQVALAQRVTQQGTLVSLARESLERESRWVESMLRSDRQGNQRGFREGLAHAEQVLRLQADIAKKREELARLRTLQERRTGVLADDSSFESIWRGQ